MKHLPLLIAALALLLGVSPMDAQQMIGSTGGFNIPTADMHPAGTIRAGATYMSNGMIDGNPRHTTHWGLDYNTGLYFISASPFSWLEATFRETLLKTVNNGKEGYFRQDRSMSVKLRPVTESRYRPAIAIGTNDPYADDYNIYGSVFVAATKHLHSQRLHSTWSASVAYVWKLPDSSNYDGLCFGVQYSPDWMPDWSVGVEHDTKGFNIGLQGCLFHQWDLFVFTRNFEDISAGLTFRYTIRY